jgi:hypothetical protein
MFRFIFSIIAVLALNIPLIKAQQSVPAQGKVEVVQDERITQLAEQYRKMSLNNPEVDGYRVQIFFESGSNSKNAATNVQTGFESVYPGVNSYLSYNEPYYRVRVGDFRTLIEAVGFQKKIEADFPNSFPVKDKIVE